MASEPLSITPAAQLPRRSKGPARPILQGVGLDGPFFGDKNRAFWVLQSLGWTGFFILRSINGIRDVDGRDVRRPHAFAYRHGLFADAAHGLALPAADRNARLVDHADQRRDGRDCRRCFLVHRDVEFRNLRPPRLASARRRILGAILLDFALLAAWSAMYYGINYYLLLEEEIDQRARLENQASSAQLAMLRYQLNPHFLFNTLNSISTLVLLKQTERANAMLARLSSFLRYTLANEPTAQVTLAQEVEQLKLYLEIEKMRFEDRLRPHFRIEGRNDWRATAVALAPAFGRKTPSNMAVTPAEDGADIWISATREGQSVRIEVADSGPGGGAGWSRSIPPVRPDQYPGPTGPGYGPRMDLVPKRTIAVVQRYHRNPTRFCQQGTTMTIRTILVDDEPLATQGLRLRLEAHDDIEIVATAANGPRGDPPDQDPQADLVFLDIQMPGFDGFSVIQGLLEVEPPLFVFVTAFGDHALRAFESQAVDYLMKPVDEDRLAGTMDRVRQRLSEKRGVEEVGRLKEALAEHAPKQPKITPTSRAGTTQSPPTASRR
jgi:DNA-binding NarL/FixJ family response regulator